jgi:hypothetical protein
MPEPEITARRFTAIQQFNRLPCPWCQQEALSTGDQDMIVGHVDPAHDALCPELARRARKHLALTLNLENLHRAMEAMADAPMRPDPPPVFTTRTRAEAYEAWKREHDVTAWSEELGGNVRRMADEHVRRLDEMLAAMPIGYRLCVHAAEWTTTPDEISFERADTVRMRIRQQIHMLAPGEVCRSEPHGRTEYGPKP